MSTASTKKVWQSQAQTQLQQWLKDGTAVKTDLSMDPKVLKPDPERLQSRVETDPEHIRNLAEVLDRGEELRPVVVFQEPETGRYMLADGFHRHGAYKKHRRPSIPAYVVQGGIDEAVKFSASANLEFSKAPSIEDRKKAIRMLLSQPGTSGWPIYRLASHCGASDRLTSQVRINWFAERGMPVPQKNPDPLEPIAKTKVTETGEKRTIYIKTIKNQKVNLGSDYSSAKASLVEIERSRTLGAIAMLWGNGRDLGENLRMNAIKCSAISAEPYCRRLAGQLINGDVVCVSADCSNTDGIYKAVGLLALVMKALPKGSVARAIICRTANFGSSIAAEVASIASNPPYPIEFMTPEELVAEFGPKAE